MPCIWWIKHRCCYIERDLSLLLVRYISNAYKMFDVCMRIYVVCVRERASRRIPVCMYCLCHSCVSLGLSHGSGALLCIWQLAAAERIPESTQNNRHTQRLCTRVVSPHETEAILAFKCNLPFCYCIWMGMVIGQCTGRVEERKERLSDQSTKFIYKIDTIAREEMPFPLLTLDMHTFRAKDFDSLLDWEFLVSRTHILLR